MYKLYAICFLTTVCFLLAVVTGLQNGPTWLGLSLMIFGGIGLLTTLGMIINDSTSGGGE